MTQLDDPSGAETQEPKPAGLFARGAAFLLDWAIILALVATFASAANVNRAGVVILLIAGWALYHVGFVVITGATPGKIAFGLHVADTRGQELQPTQALMRSLVLLAGVLAGGIGVLISLLLVLWDPRRRALHDRAAGTLVLEGQPDLPETGKRD